MTTHAVRVEIAGAAVTIQSEEQYVTDWCDRYFGTWWKMTKADGRDVGTGAEVTAKVSTRDYDDIAHTVSRAPHTTASYGGGQILIARDVSEGVIRAVQTRDAVAYWSRPAWPEVDIVGCHAEDAAMATARVARDVIRGQLLRANWSVLHASAVVQDGRTILTLGKKGAGKTSTALALATRHGLGLLSNDRVFVRPDRSGGVEVLPWPSAAAVGLGLMDALGWIDVAREWLDAGEVLHPTQDSRVTKALREGGRTALWDGPKELKVQVFPDQFTSWFGVPLATEGRVAAVVFPRIARSAAPALEDTARTVSESDFLFARTEDRYPDVFGLVGEGFGAPRHEVARRLDRLPHYTVVLGHDVQANADFLSKLTDSVERKT
ncbi:hypothetical protein [Streptomyces afghaniensis]|uniref:hypothetical protein n=1 Tax=Streptomyces afghaniensis TaxID=66865 RepID=UPI00278A0917|nr:hypothetical protein [Streptomyces afghaniensis]MDQ1019007.1 hypothetical protein [Streptomyces afghaniensis]